MKIIAKIIVMLMGIGLLLIAYISYKIGMVR